jgi:hypothetical protein
MEKDRSVRPFASSAVTSSDRLKHFGIPVQVMQTACHINPIAFSDGKLVGGRGWRTSTRYILNIILEAYLL